MSSDSWLCTLTSTFLTDTAPTTLTMDSRMFVNESYCLGINNVMLWLVHIRHLCWSGLLSNRKRSWRLKLILLMVRGCQRDMFCLTIPSARNEHWPNTDGLFPPIPLPPPHTHAKTVLHFLPRPSMDSRPCMTPSMTCLKCREDLKILLSNRFTDNIQ